MTQARHDRLPVRRRRRDLATPAGRRRRSARACAGSASPSCGGRAGCAPRRAPSAARRRSGAARRRRRRRGRGSRRPSGSARACRPRSATSPEAISWRTFACSFAPSALVRSATRTPELRADALDREEVLLGEDLGRRHQRALPAGLDGPQQRRERDDGLPRADVALQQPLHRRRAREVAVDLGDRPLLRLGEREREHLAVALQQLARRRQRLGDERLALGGPARERELEDEELVEGEPPPALLGLLRRARPVQRRRARRPEAAGRSAAASAAGSASPSARGRARAPRRRARAAASARAPRWPGRRARSRPSPSPRRGRSSRPGSRSGSSFPRSADARAGRQLRLEPRLVEPRRADLAGVVGDPRREDLQPAAAAPRGGRADDSLDRPPPRRPKRSRIERSSIGRSYRRGRCASRSPTVRRPSLASRFRTAGPTRGSVSTPAASASGRGALRGRGQRSAGPAPPKPTGEPGLCQRACHRAEYRTGTAGDAALRRPGTRRSRRRPGRRACRRRRRGSRRARSPPAGAPSRPGR